MLINCTPSTRRIIKEPRDVEVKLAAVHHAIRMRHEKEFCLGIHISIASVGIGVIFTVVAAFVMVQCCIGVAKLGEGDGHNIFQYFQEEGPMREWDDNAEFRQTLVAILIVIAAFSGVYCLCSIGVVVGVITNRPELIQPWLIMQWAFLGLSVIAAFVVVTQQMMSTIGPMMFVEIPVFGLIIGYIYFSIYVVKQH